MMDSNDIKTKALGLIPEYIVLIDNNASDEDFERWRQSIRERYPKEFRAILLAVRVWLEEHNRREAI